MFERFKKILATVAIVAGAAMTLTGCGGDAKTLKVGAPPDSPPFAFEENGKPVGFDVDLLNAIGKEIGREFVFEVVKFEDLIPAVEDNKVNLAVGSLSISDKRADKVDFSDPYYNSALTFVVRDDDAKLDDIVDLFERDEGLTVGTISGTAGDELGGAKIKYFDKIPDCYNALVKRDVDAVIIDRPLNEYFIKHGNFAGLKILPGSFRMEAYGIAVAKGNDELVKEINAALKKLRANGEYQKIYDKWFGNAGKN